MYSTNANTNQQSDGEHFMYILGSYTSSAYKILDNFAIVSVFVGQPPPMITSGEATLDFLVTFSVAEVVEMYLIMSSIALSIVHCSVRRKHSSNHKLVPISMASRSLISFNT